MNKKISVFLPLRSGSQRVKNKNTRPFLQNGKSIFQLKMCQLIELTDYIDEIIISTNDSDVIQQAQEFLNSKVKLIERPEYLCLSTTKVVDLINYVPTVIASDHVFWLHATAPFVDAEDYLSAIKLYSEKVLNGNHDSLMSVNKLQQFIWSDQEKRVINVDRSINPWPNTQDLEPLFEINHAFYISSRDNYLQFNDRIGQNPCLFETTSVKKIDIDWPDDFELAVKIASTMDLK
ncbi:cytidylyltransferase domain-containing protein [Thiomicrorhabdus sp. 6S3-12]|uniref:acylneuraminate cytidylyltransferase family protein n=1 Tax=Thiomicrorhabdus sp. 6S3-12 TaxID=2819681 RepID=UPI001AAD8F57|nr:hypothetical protein [Thiomicrorhabdus sp. 6S3-12]MBO1922994.1 hypothetical protein [Thiomicrorhabdus sp. 6S3-12]